ncbi:PilZ domain-containing protein [Bdellovibrio sp. HCB209]|uniref:PilZ domain-containing protein n=1 Tax=Bdellovibrio sp. HCB209 TaxID=3394354 RepID=UPI0039B45282
MSKIWFILNDGQVTGPFEPGEVESQIASFKEPLIWGRGQVEWDTPSKWRVKVKEMVPVSAPGDQSKNWMTRIEGKVNKEAFKYSDMIVQLKKMTDLSQVDISTDGGKTWKEVYALQQVVDDLGISRRSHPRVPIVGTLEFEVGTTSATVKCRVISISEGGLGINDAESLQIGQKFFATLTSPNLYQTITTTCEVVYMGNDGYAGLRFVGLPEEFKSSVIEYVRKFATLS